jgi:hypothetical protein
MGNNSLVLTKRMAQSIIKEGVIRDMELFNDLTTELKQATDDPEAKYLLNRLNLIRISGLTQKPAAPSSEPAAPLNPPAPVNQPISAAPAQPKVVAPVQPQAAAPVPPRVNQPIQPKVNIPPVQQKPNPPVQQKPAPQPQAKPQTNVFGQPKAAPVQPAKNVQNQSANNVQAQPKAAPAPAKETMTEEAGAAGKTFPAWLWILPIILVLPGGLIAAVMAKKYTSRNWELIVGGIITTILYGLLVYVKMNYVIKF